MRPSILTFAVAPTLKARIARARNVLQYVDRDPLQTPNPRFPNWSAAG
jgi:hypothetical protein